MKFLKSIEVTRPSDGFKLECVDRPPAAACVLFNYTYTEILMVKQFRAGTNCEISEIPAGKIDNGEYPEEAIVREIREETGYAEKDILDLQLIKSIYPSVGYTNEVIYIFSARLKENAQHEAQDLDENEQVECEWVDVKTVPFITSDMKTILGLMTALQKPKKKIGIYGGTFNPITNLHLLTGQRAIEEFDLDMCVFEVVGDKYAKENIIPAKDRHKMVELATIDNDHMGAGDFEIRQLLQPSTIDTLQFYQKLYGWADIYFICGSDVLEDMPNWPRTNELLEKFNVICIQRNGDNIYQDIILKNNVLVKHKKKIHIIYENVLNNISSSALRNLVKNDQSIQYLTPNLVIKYIKENNLYK